MARSLYLLDLKGLYFAAEIMGIFAILIAICAIVFFSRILYKVKLDSSTHGEISYDAEVIRIRITQGKTRYMRLAPKEATRAHNRKTMQEEYTISEKLQKTDQYNFAFCDN